MTAAHANWERKGNAIDRRMRAGLITHTAALRAHIRNDAAYDDALNLEEKTARGAALADNPQEAPAACR